MYEYHTHVVVYVYEYVVKVSFVLIVKLTKLAWKSMSYSCGECKIEWVRRIGWI